MVGGSHREVSFAIAGPIPEIVRFPSRIPTPFLGVDVVKAGVCILIEANVIEDEELGFGAEIGGIGDARVFQVQLGLARDPARVAIVMLARDRIDNVAGHHQRPGFIERVDVCGAGVRDQQHIAFIDRRPSANARPVDAKARFKGAFIQFRYRIRDVLL